MSFAFASRRSPVLARNGMVASSQPLATMAGVKILMQGGNAADAAVATAAALNVTEPTSTGIGGDMFALYYDARTKQVTALNGSGRSPAALDWSAIHRHISASPDNILANPYHALNITVPGACAGWFDLIARYGSMPMRGILAPAIELAEKGFPVAPLTAHFWQQAEKRLRNTWHGDELLIGGRAPRAGELFRNPGLARTFRTIAEEGRDAFYCGAIASAIAEVVQKSRGVLTREDLQAHESTWDEPICTTYHGYRIWECPPNGQGLAALLALNILEECAVQAVAPLSAERLHLLIEAMRLGFADARWYVADPQFAPAPLDALLSKEYAAQRRALIDLKSATLDTKHGAPVASSDTVYFCVVDGASNACSFINSNYMGFGTGIVPEGWGFTLQNRGAGFTLEPSHPNEPAPRKRPYHTIIPGMMTRDPTEPGCKPCHELVGPFGVMGGFMQPQGHVQVLVALIDDGLDPQAALDRPRFCLTTAKPDSRVEIEEGIPLKTIEALAQMGHSVALTTDYARATFGRGQIILRKPDGTLWGGSDPRADGCAIGF